VRISNLKAGVLICVEDLRADWRALKPKKRRPGPKAGVATRRAEATAAAESLHEDWIAVKGGKHPPYGYLVRWNHPTAFVIFKFTILGKGRDRGGVYYRVRYAGIFYKTPGYRPTRDHLPDDEILSPAEVCFTLEQVQRHILGHRRHHLNMLASETAKLHGHVQNIANDLQYLAESIRRIRDDQVPDKILSKLPKKASKRV
jgi:hypothetical protein